MWLGGRVSAGRVVELLSWSLGALVSRSATTHPGGRLQPPRWSISLSPASGGSLPGGPTHHLVALLAHVLVLVIKRLHFDEFVQRLAQGAHRFVAAKHADRQRNILKGNRFLWRFVAALQAVHKVDHLPLVQPLNQALVCVSVWGAR